ncbi:MAG: hypothetical protein R2818_12685 [Flavobacteriales bacterium]
MNALHLSFALLLVSAPFASTVHTHAPAAAPGPTAIAAAPAAVEGVFAKEVIDGLLKASGCTGIRFYTVLRNTDPSSSSVVAIPVDKDGKEIQSWFLGSPYRMYTALSGSSVGVEKLSRNKASDACIRYTTAGGSCFAATVSSSDVLAVLDTKCAAVQLVVVDGKFQMSAANVADGKLQMMGTGPTYQRMSGDPCPVVCGADPSVFLKMK